MGCTITKTLICTSILESLLCFSESSAFIAEDQGSAILMLHLTNPSSTDITVTINTTDQTANGMYIYT